MPLCVAAILKATEALATSISLFTKKALCMVAVSKTICRTASHHTQSTARGKRRMPVPSTIGLGASSQACAHGGDGDDPVPRSFANAMSLETLCSARAPKKNLHHPASKSIWNITALIYTRRMSRIISSCRRDSMCRNPYCNRNKRPCQNGCKPNILLRFFPCTAAPTVCPTSVFLNPSRSPSFQHDRAGFPFKHLHPSTFQPA